jgi:hypothetical protein
MPRLLAAKLPRHIFAWILLIEILLNRIKRGEYFVSVAFFGSTEFR